MVIADIHGHFDALQRLKREFGYNPIEHQLIYLGDYIDRGPNSCEVVNEVMREVLEEDAIALLGNHERMMLNALTTEPNRILGTHYTSTAVTVILAPSNENGKNANQYIALIGIFLSSRPKCYELFSILVNPPVNVVTNDNKTACLKSGMP